MNKFFCLGTIKKDAEVKTFKNDGKNARIFVEIPDQKWDREAQEMVEVFITIEIDSFDSKKNKLATRAASIPVGTTVLCEAKVGVDTWKDQNNGSDKRFQKLNLQDITPLGGSSAQEDQPADALGGRF